MHKYLYRKSKPRNFYILVAIAMPVAITIFVLAWTAGNLRTALDMGIAPILWSVCLLVVAWDISRQQKANKTYAPKRTPLRRGMVISFNIFWLLSLVGSIIILAEASVRDKPLYITLMSVWLIIVGGGHLFFAPFDDYILRSRSWWRF
ncbi:MAG: hypothetical protein D4S01_06665 [Dehalococcoidia bacterium]|nr:MAG: hypothetical protein D4S01_06665 [Dehalococcoidia bacterium]